MRTIKTQPIINLTGRRIFIRPGKQPSQEFAVDPHPAPLEMDTTMVVLDTLGGVPVRRHTPSGRSHARALNRLKTYREQEPDAVIVVRPADMLHLVDWINAGTDEDRTHVVTMDETPGNVILTDHGQILAYTGFRTGY